MLKQFQLEGACFLAGKTRALLADEPGVGKTAQVVHACDLIGAKTVLVVCPAVGVQHWKREFRRWSNNWNVNLPQVISYEQARTLHVENHSQQQFPYPTKWDVLVVDECHYAKNPAAKRTNVIFGKGGLGWYAKHIWSLSGTPSPNHAGELWPMLKAYGATPMRYEEFVAHFCRVDWQGKIKGTNIARVDELKVLLKPFTLRRKKRDVLSELGEIDVQEWYVEPSAAYTGGSTKIGKEGSLRQYIKAMSQKQILEFLASNTQEFATLRRYNALLKVPAVYEQVQFELENNLLDKVVIYGYHKEPLEILREKFSEGYGAVLINGDTPAKERDRLIQMWKNQDKPRVMLASIIAAGVVLDFTEAHQGIMLELDWVPGNNAQAMQRMHRIGQDMPVTIRVAIGSEIDELVSDVVLRKTRELSRIFE